MRQASFYLLGSITMIDDLFDDGTVGRELAPVKNTSPINENWLRGKLAGKAQPPVAKRKEVHARASGVAFISLGVMECVGLK